MGLFIVGILTGIVLSAGVAVLCQWLTYCEEGE